MTPVTGLEVPPGRAALETLWLRGGFPESLLAGSDAASLALRKDFIRTYLERDAPEFGPRVPAETLARLWTMLAHGQGGLLNASVPARSLEISAQSVTRYIDLLCDLLLLRRLRPYAANIGKRLVKSPKIYVRDSGILHALLDIGSADALTGHPVVGGSWEGFVIETLVSALSWPAQPYFYRSAAGAEIDLVLDRPDGLWAVEIKRGAARPRHGFHIARKDLKAARSFVVHAGEDRYPLGDGVEALGLRELAEMVGG
jgi:predicted AAA+ superfamily ATPase